MLSTGAMLPFEKAGADEWVTPMMSAFVDVRPGCWCAGLKFTLLFVSRRSKARQGCRFTMRGADEDGCDEEERHPRGRGGAR